tara:strand:+ start:2633 stop:2824 length:192 start_codon:yes stop_codon:yes gene_type:complete
MASDDHKDRIISEISTVVESLSLKLATLQAKVNELCNSTDCQRVKKVNADLLCKKESKRKTED